MVVVGRASVVGAQVAVGRDDAVATIVIAAKEPTTTTTSEPTRWTMVNVDDARRRAGDVRAADEPLKRCPCVFMTSIFENENHQALYVNATFAQLSRCVEIRLHQV